MEENKTVMSSDNGSIDIHLLSVRSISSTTLWRQKTPCDCAFCLLVTKSKLKGVFYENVLCLFHLKTEDGRFKMRLNKANDVFFATDRSRWFLKRVVILFQSALALVASNGRIPRSIKRRKWWFLFTEANQWSVKRLKNDCNTLVVVISPMGWKPMKFVWPVYLFCFCFLRFCLCLGQTLLFF